MVEKVDVWHSQGRGTKRRTKITKSWEFGTIGPGAKFKRKPKTGLGEERFWEYNLGERDCENHHYSCLGDKH